MTDTKQRRSVQGIIALIEERYEKTCEAADKAAVEVTNCKASYVVFHDLLVDFRRKEEVAGNDYKDAQNQHLRICAARDSLRDILSEFQVEEQ